VAIFGIMSSSEEVFLGVVLAAIGACCLALAMSVQRYGLKTPPPVPFLGCHLGQFWVWFSGLLIYWVANGLFAVSLIYAPLALLGAIFTTLLVWNLLFGWLLLGETITVIKSVGATLIMVGVALIGIATPTVPNDYSVALVESYLNDTVGAIYLGTLISIVFICVIGIAFFERKYPLTESEEPPPMLELGQTLSSDPLSPVISHKFSVGDSKKRYQVATLKSRTRSMSRSIVYSLKKKNTDYLTEALMRNNGLRRVEPSVRSPPHGLLVNISRQVMIRHVIEKNDQTPAWLEKLMGVVYPGSLGLDEGIGHLAMKAFMALLSSCGDKNDCGAAILWGMIMLWLVSSLATLWWLQTVFRRYDVTQALPIEYGAVMACDALSAIMFYKEDDYMEDWQLALTLCGLAVIIVGILVGRCQSSTDL